MHSVKFTTLFAIAFACALSLGMVAPWVQAGVCGVVGLDDGCVTSGDIEDGALLAQDRGDGSGADFHQAATAETILLSTRAMVVASDNTVRGIALMAPAAGVVIVNASGFFTLAGPGSGSCSIAADRDFDPASATTTVQDSEGVEKVPFGLTRAFQVPAGSAVFNLVCNGSGDARLTNPALTAVFVPTRY